MEKIAKDAEKIATVDIEQNKNAKNLLKLSVSNENLQIKELTFTLQNCYVQRLRNITFTYSIAIDNDKTALSETTDVQNSSIFASYYTKIETMLKVFHKFYRIKETDIWLDPSASSMQSKMKFRMTGVTGVIKENDTEFNIWNFWTDLETSNNPFDDELKKI